MKLDLIIPVYNNKKGLYRSLMSIGIESADYVDVTIVDDCSIENYDDIIAFFAQFFPVRILKLEKNSGPGNARQYGIDHTYNQYLTFLDCGDYFISPDILEAMHYTIEENPTPHMFCWDYISSRDEQQSNEDNRMHGKVYRREFLQQHHIRFNPKESYINEDIGFNMACRMILKQEEIQRQRKLLFEDSTNVLIWDKRDDSISKKNNYAIYYSTQNMALAENGGYAIRLARRERVNDNIIANQIYEIMCDMYFRYLSTVAARPEFIEIAFDGALRFYCQYFRAFGKYNVQLLMEMYYNTLVQYLADPLDDIRTKWTRLDFLEFLDMLEEQANNKGN